MRDQAEKLRKLINKKNKEIKVGRSARVIAITSGKGGVGKSNIALNLALDFIKANKRVIIIDADMGLANIEILLGVVPKYNLLDVIEGNKIITEIITEVDGGLKFISGGSGVNGINNLSKDRLNYFTQNLSLLDKMFDIIIIDTGAGIADSVMKFLSIADDIILVTTPEPTSITDAYALLKIFSNGCMSDENSEIGLLVNKVNKDNEGLLIYDKINKVTDKFLNLKLNYLGVLPYDQSLGKAVIRQTPFLVDNPKSNISKHLNDITSKILGEVKDDKKNVGIQTFIDLLRNKR